MRGITRLSLIGLADATLPSNPLFSPLAEDIDAPNDEGRRLLIAMLCGTN